MTLPSLPPYSGIWPVAPTPFHDDGTLDLEGMRRVLDCMIDQGVDGITQRLNPFLGVEGAAASFEPERPGHHAHR